MKGRVLAHNMNKRKIINDPIYGFITIPSDIIFDLMEHKWFQRLRRIKQLALTHYVYPGALHTRFHHALGALHLTTQAIDVLRSKGVQISEEEAEAVLIAILLHDIGHGPFSHALEHTLMDIHHEDLSLLFMQKLNVEFDGKLTLAIDIFSGKYHKPFLHQLVSGQLDMDRMDYLSRDSFFTGVAEGVIGFHRIIKMLMVHDNRLCIEEKGIYSIERFLTARRLMYWQVYLHKSTLAAEVMMISVLKRAKQLAESRGLRTPSAALNFFLEKNFTVNDLDSQGDAIIKNFALLDDSDIIMALKAFSKEEDFTIRFISEGLLHRKLFRVEISDRPFTSDHIKKIRQKIELTFQKQLEDVNAFFIQGEQSNTTYTILKDEIMIISKKGELIPMSKVASADIRSQIITKHYLCYPKTKS